MSGDRHPGPTTPFFYNEKDKYPIKSETRGGYLKENDEPETLQILKMNNQLIEINQMLFDIHLDAKSAESGLLFIVFLLCLSSAGGFYIIGDYFHDSASDLGDEANALQDDELWDASSELYSISAYLFLIMGFLLILSLSALISASRIMYYRRKVVKQIGSEVDNESESIVAVWLRLPQSDSFTCSNCGYKSLSQTTHCSICDADMRQITRPVIEQSKEQRIENSRIDGLSCPNCGRNVEINWKRCPYCATNIHTTEKL